MKKIVLIVGLLILTFGCLDQLIIAPESPRQVAEPTAAPAAPKAVERPAEVDIIKIGFIDALSGDAATYGEVSKNSAMIAVDEINAAGGVRGKKLKVIYEDGKCTGKDAVAATEKLISIDKVKVILGWSCSGMVLSAAPLANKNKVIIFSGYATSPLITKAGDYVFRNAYSDADMGVVAAELVAEKHKTVGILSEQTDFAQAYKDVFVKEFEKKGGKVVADEVFMQEARDYRSQIVKIMAAKPEAIWVDPQTDKTGGTAIKQLRELGWEGPIYGTFFAESPGAVEIAGNAMEGVIFAADPVVDPKANSKAAELLGKYKARYGKDPAYFYPFASDYDAVYIMANAIEEVDYDADKIKDWLYAMDWYEGVLGKYKFDENGDVVGVKPVKKIVRNGKAEFYEGS